MIKKVYRLYRKKVSVKWTFFRERTKDKTNESKVIAYEFSKNFKQLVKDFDEDILDDENENTKATISDIAKMVGIGAIFVLPGGSAGIVALKKFLDSDKAKKWNIPNFMELSIMLKSSPLDSLGNVPNGKSKASFRGYSESVGTLNSGIDLECKLGDRVYSIECGDVVDVFSTKYGFTVMVEGASGVFCYCGLNTKKQVGENVECAA